MFIGTMTRSQVLVELIATEAAIAELQVGCWSGDGFLVAYVDLRTKKAALKAALKATHPNHESGSPVPMLTNK